MAFFLVWISAVLLGLTSAGWAAEEVKFGQILVRTRDEADAVRNELLEKGGDVKAFKAAAQKHSLDPRTKRTGGTMGWFRREQMPPEIPKTVFDMKKGELSDPIPLTAGWLLVLFEDRREEERFKTICRLPPPPPERLQRLPPAPPPALPVVKIVTVRGELLVEVFQDDARSTAAHFIELVEAGFFNPDASTKQAQTFYSVIPGTAVVTGSPANDSQGGPGHRIPSETLGNKRVHERGTLTMLLDTDPNSGNPVPDSAGSQFMICLKDVRDWNGIYTPFGRVTQGLDILDRIQEGDAIQSISVVSKPRRLQKSERLPATGTPAVPVHAPPRKP